MPDEADDDGTSAEVALWLDVVREAHAIHASFPSSMKAEIDAASSPREIALLAIPLARISTATRQRIEDALLALLDQPPVNRPEEFGQLLTLVPAR